MASRKFITDGQNTPFTVIQIEHLYNEEGLTLREIAERFGVTHQAVHERLKRAGVQLRRRATRPRPVPIDEKTLRRLYETEKLSVREMAERLGATWNKVDAWLRRCNIERRRPGTHKRNIPIAGLAVGESVVVPRPRRRNFQSNFHWMAHRKGMRVSVRTVDDKTVRITRIQ